MTLNELFEILDSKTIPKLCNHTNQVIPGSCFFCTVGASADRHDFVETAIEKGALFIVHSRDLPQYHDHVTYIRVEDVQTALIEATDRYYDYPSQKLTLFGMTGTNGKTSTSISIYDILESLKFRTGYMGTIAIKYGDKHFPPTLTTPDTIDLHSYLHDMVEDKVTCCIVEASSEGIASRRLEDIDFDCIGYTNLTQDHLDVHKTMEHYFEVKKRLFDNAKDSAIFVINADDDYGQRLIKAQYPQKIFTYGLSDGVDYQGKNLNIQSTKTTFDLVVAGKTYHVVSPLLATFNVYNVICAIAMIHQQTNIDLQEIVDAVQNIKLVLGRLNYIDMGQDFTVIVDFSHTPDGMEKLYEYCETICKPPHRIISVFGSAGGRDHEKRPMMGAIADKYSALVYLTEDDPRKESIEQISKEIHAGIQNATVIYEPNRYKAIESAIMDAKPKDVIVVMGKGPEPHQDRAHGKEPWMTDEGAVRKILEEQYGKAQ